MGEPAANPDEHIGKTVGDRRPPDPLALQPDAVADAEHWRRAFGGIRGRPGVYRFKSHEEADAWMIAARIRRPS